MAVNKKILDPDVSRVWSYWLTFKSKEAEESYREHRNATLYETLPLLHTSGTLIGILVFSTYSIFRIKSWQELLQALVTEVLGGSFACYLTFFHRASLIRWYDLVCLVVQILISYFLGQQATIFQENAQHAAVSVLMRFSPFGAMFFCPIFYPTAYWRQFWGQLIGLAASNRWTHNVCSKPALSDGLHKGVNSLLWYTKTWLSTVFVTKPLGKHVDCSCVVSLEVVHFTLLFVTPCSLKYIVESQARAAYLAHRFPSSAHESIKLLFWENIRLCGVGTLLALITVLLVIHGLDTW